MKNRTTSNKKIHDLFISLGISKNDLADFNMEFSQTTISSYTNKLLGKIFIIINNDEIRIKAMKELIQLEKVVDEKILSINKAKDQKSALELYALSFFYLNKKSPLITSITNNLSLVDCLEGLTDIQQRKLTQANLPTIILISDEMMSKFRHLAFTNNQIILLCIKPNVGAQELLKNILYEFQRWYNSFYLSTKEEDVTIPYGLFQTTVNELTQLFYTRTFNDKLYLTILKSIQCILKTLTEDDLKKSFFDKLSAHFTSLLISYTPDDIRKVINLMQKSVNLAKNFFHAETLFLCQWISLAFDIIENTLHHLGLSLYQFTINKTVEALEICADKSFLFKIMTPAVLNLSTPENNSWSNHLAAIKDINKGAKYILEAALYTDLSYSLREQAKMGNNNMLKFLLSITLIDIDKLDKKEFTPIACAVMNSRHSTVKLLFEYGASITWKGCIEGIADNTLLHLAASHFNFEIIPWLLKRGLFASALNSRRQTALLIISKHIEQICQRGFLSEKIYRTSIKAIAYLLSYSDETPNYLKNKFDSQFYQSLINFRKIVAFLYLVNKNAIIRRYQHLSNGILFTTVLQIYRDFNFDDYHKKYYNDIFYELNNQNLLNKFISLGMHDVYREMTKLKNNGGKIVLEDANDNLVSEKELLGSILEVCQALDVNITNNPIYQNLIILLSELIIENNRSISNYSPKMFMQKLKLIYQERCEMEDAKKLVIN